MRGVNVAVVDWSAASSPTPRKESKDAIWIGIRDATGAREIYCRTRHEAEVLLRQMIEAGNWLIGFDFPMGYPSGFAARLTGRPEARAVWHWLETAIEDAPNNRNNRFAVAAGVNRRFGGGPFWGRPATLDLPDLPERKTVDYAALGLSERRVVEDLVRNAQPVWKLYTTGSVGSQALMGLPLIARLSRQHGVAVWPFDAPARVTLAEVYPSLLAPAVAAEGDKIKDRAQVRLLARALSTLAANDRLGPLLDCPAEAAEEGWILGAGHAAALASALAEAA